MTSPLMFGWFITLTSLFVAEHRVNGRYAEPRAECADVASYRSLVRTHVQRYPAMQDVDAFKLLHHATMGSEHAIGEVSSAEGWLEREWSSMGTGPSEPLIDTLGMNGRFARVHLRTLRSANGDRATLLRAFVTTSRMSGDTVQLSCALRTLVQLSRLREVPWPVDSLETRHAQWAKRGYPAVSHSAQFRELYRPAYRVVAIELVRDMAR